MFRNEIGFNFLHWLPRKISRANLSCQLPGCLSLKRDEGNLLWNGLFYCCFSDFVSSLEVFNFRFCSLCYIFKPGLVIKRRVTGFKGRVIDIFPLPAAGDCKYKLLFLNTSCFELLLQHCHLIYSCVLEPPCCPGDSYELLISLLRLPWEALENSTPFHKSLLIPKQ